ncbi:MAG TPA: hypothetical protein VI282_19155 [Verrucomicrobiae bacterium]|jgi:hypothetical protein
MKTKAFFVLTAAGFLLTSVPVIAKDKGKSHKNDAAASPAADGKAQSAGPAAANANDHKEPWANVNVTIGNGEKEQIREYVRNCEIPHKGKKNKGLPPGLAKKVARGGDLPPGWQKKCVRGEILPEPIFKASHPLPHELIVKLPPAPAGTIMVAIDGKIVRLAKATREILDVFDVR